MTYGETEDEAGAECLGTLYTSAPHLYLGVTVDLHHILPQAQDTFSVLFTSP